MIGASILTKTMNFADLQNKYANKKGGRCYSAEDRIMNKYNQIPEDETPFCFNHSVLLWASLPVWMFHVVHLNMCVNIRLEMWERFNPCFIFWKPINLLFCKLGYSSDKRGCQYFCQDRFPNPPTLVRHIAMICYAIGMD